MQHLTVPASTAADILEDGVAFDGSSVRGFQAINESDMALFPDSATARLDPFRKHKTLNINFFVHDPITGEPYSRDPRNVARKAEEYLAASGIADTCYFGAEAEFYIFDSVRFGSDPHQQFHHIDSVEGWWNTGRDEDGGNLGYKVTYKGGYFPVAAGRPLRRPARRHGHQPDRNAGFEVERGHHEVGTAGQAEINYKFNTLLHAADDMMLFKYIDQEHRLARRQDRHVHAEAALRRQRLGHARPPVAVEGRPAAVPRRGRLRRPLGHGALLHRRPAAPRPEPAGLHQPDGELLPPPGARLRGAGQPGLLRAQPLGLHPDPAHRATTRRPSASSSAAPTRRATRTWRSRR